MDKLSNLMYDFEKMSSIINSCVNRGHIDVARYMVFLFKEKYEMDWINPYYESLNNKLKIQTRRIINGLYEEKS